jgi:hypothetical protein
MLLAAERLVVTTYTLIMAPAHIAVIINFAAVWDAVAACATGVVPTAKAARVGFRTYFNIEG